MRARSFRTMSIAVALLLSGLLALLGCKKAGGPDDAAGATAEEADEEESSGGDLPTPNSAVHKSGGKSASAVMGPPGGSLSLASGAKLEVPAGSFERGTEVVLSDAPGSTAFLNSEHQRPIGPVFSVSPAIEAKEGRTIRVSIPLATYPQGWGDIQLGYEYRKGDMVGADDAEHTQWATETAKLAGGRAVAEVPALPGYRLQFVLSNLESQ